MGRSGSDNPVFETLCHKTRFLCFFFAGDCRSAAASAGDAIEVARRSGLRFEECLHLHNLAEQYIRLGERPHARDALERSLVLSMDSDRWLEMKQGSPGLSGRHRRRPERLAVSNSRPKLSNERSSPGSSCTRGIGSTFAFFLARRASQRELERAQLRASSACASTRRTA
jgi:hypothetical protein